MRKTSIGQEVIQEGSLREGLEAAIRERVREIIEMVLEEEVESTLGASRHQRVAERSGYRHGRKSRRLTLRTGTVRVGVPRARLVDAAGSEREWQSQLVPRYRRSSPEVEQSVLGVYLSGSNTRRIRRAPVLLTEGPGAFWNAVPGRDGKRFFLFGARPGLDELSRYEIKTKRLARYMPDIPLAGATYSRDGKWIAYTVGPDPESTIWSGRADGTERRIPADAASHPVFQIRDVEAIVEAVHVAHV